MLEVTETRKLFDGGVIFLGQSMHKLDAKNRVHVPARFRSPVKSRGNPDGVAFTRFFLKPFNDDDCVFLMTEDQFFAMATQWPMESTAADDRGRQRDFFGDVEQVELDNQGRITLSPDIIELLFGPEAKDSKKPREALMVGAGMRAEIWNPKTWEARKKKRDGSNA